MSNARIQFSTASEEKWLQVNPVLREGELVIARKANGKRKLVVGKPGGSSYANSEVVWDAEQAETYMNTTKDLSENVNVFVPHIDSSGILTWTNKAGLDNPSPITIKGIKGDPGEKGDKGDRGEQGAQGIQGPRGIQGATGERGPQGLQGPKGDKGDTGATGAPGAAATIRIGNVYTGAPGTNVSVSNSGTSTNAVLNFTIPRGNPGADGGVTVDAELSDTSTNPIQNKAVKTAIDTVTASIPTKVSALENDAGYLTFGNLPNFPTTDSENIWDETQIFKEALLRKTRIAQEVYTADYMSGTAITPTTSTMCLTATGAVTLDMATIVTDLLEQSRKNVTVFTAYIISDADYTLTITNAGTIKYIGSASDVAITSAGLLLNIMMLKDASRNLTSIVQASKLS